MGLEADKVEVLLLELLYKTDYSNDFDREVRTPQLPAVCRPSGPRELTSMYICLRVPLCRCASCVCAVCSCVYLECMCL